MTSAGGVATVEGATRQPANLLMSGPGGRADGRPLGRRGWPGYDERDHARRRRHLGRHRRGPGGELRLKHLLDTSVAGYHAMIPMAELDTIGAGGGSLAYVDETGMFHVGPQSAGAVPVPPATCAAAHGRP